MGVGQRPTLMTTQDMNGLRSLCKGCPDRKYDKYRESVDKHKTSKEYREYLKAQAIKRRFENV